MHSSMNKKDVQKKTNNSITKCSRWEAVFECMDEFLSDQQKTNTEDDDSNATDGNNSHAGASVVVSVVIFNEEGKTLVERMPLLGNGSKVKKALQNARQMHNPTGGTGFAAGFKQAKIVATTAGGTGNNNKQNDNIVLVFLSDGRPGDLHDKGPPNRTIAMQSSFKLNGKIYPAAGQYIEAMQRTFGPDRFHLHLICIYEHGKPVCIRP